MSDLYDAYLVSVFGVIHDRTSVIQGSRDCLVKLSERGKTVMIFTNTPKRASTVIRQLSQIGVPPSLYQHVLTSGEEAFQAVKNRTDLWHAILGKYCYYLGSMEADDLIDELEIYPVNDIARADFILAIGVDPFHNDLDYYDGILKKAASRRLPMVCANPDQYVVDKGEKILRVGYFAKRYQDLGGQVRFHGKPDASFYEKALLKLKRFSLDKILAIGDSLETDIIGAQQAGLHTLCVTDNFYLSEESGTLSEQDKIKNLNEIFKQERVDPTYALFNLKW